MEKMADEIKLNRKFVDSFQTAKAISEKFSIDYFKICEAMKEIPSADVQEVRHGYWKGYTRSAFHSVDEIGNPVYRDVNVWQCSECNRKSVIKENYCPNCGARMDGDDNDKNRI